MYWEINGKQTPPTWSRRAETIRKLLPDLPELRER
jgi:hypothetical protein